MVMEESCQGHVSASGSHWVFLVYPLHLLCSSISNGRDTWAGQATQKKKSFLFQSPKTEFFLYSFQKS